MYLHLKIAASLVLVNFSVMAQSSPVFQAGQPLSASALEKGFSAKQDLGGPISSPFGAFDALVVSINPSSEAPIYTSGNTADQVTNNSQYGLAALWSILDGGTSHDAIAGITRSVAGTTVTELHGMAGYCDNDNSNNVTSFVGVCVGVGGFAVNRVDGAQSWLFSGILSDAGPPGPIGRLMQGELDYKPLYANTQVNGFIGVLDGPVQPTVADAWVAGSTYNGTTRLAKWNNGFRTYPAQVSTAFLADQSLPAGAISSNSQPISMNASDGSGVTHKVSISVQGSAGAVVISRDDSAPVNLVIAGGGSVNTQFVQFSPSQNVSALPTCNAGNAGKMALVGNALSPTYNATLTGGGAVMALALCNGVNWTAH